MTTNTASDRTIVVYIDPQDGGLAWKDNDGSGAYGDPQADAAAALIDLYDAADEIGLHATWDPNDGGSLTITGPADHPILVAAR